ncbi:nitrate- and nitrite sensing domain-containing protein [Nonomuraea sp. NBC_01738]|uniref:nitrate- and nitrite sensing domain-containing protein n=1 Tax=Nonomuraea sp. NBC_01738 TaxID=2976003 RepID=UPI002E11B321|nr:nitrate- and nitrite sensing domain-containing protein [Nonomuraea sp. NBC_01738]
MASQSLRFKLYSLLSLPIVALIALWTFVSGHVVGDFFELRTATTVYEKISAPAAALVTELQHERKSAAIFLSAPPPDGSMLVAARKRTNAAASVFRVLSASEEAQTVTTPGLRGSIDEVLRRLGGLDAVRREVDDRTTSRLAAVQAYGAITDEVYRLYDQLVTVPQIELYQQATALLRISHARDLMSREDALVTGAILAKRLSHEEYEAIEELAPNRRLLLVDGIASLERDLRGPYDLLLASADHRRFGELEHEIIESSRLPHVRNAWPAVSDRLGATLDRLQVSSAGLLNARAADAADAIVLEIAIVGVIGLAAIVAAVIWSARLGRGLAAELDLLRDSAAELADVRLPRVVERLRGGEPVDVDAEAPAIPVGGTTQEVRDVGHAFAGVRRTAVEAAVGQAALRRGLGRVFRNMALRHQALVHRQLAQLDGIRLRITEPEILQDLFRLDRLTTRMRRQAEGLLILAGGADGHPAPTGIDEGGDGRQAAVPIADVVRDAIAEAEAYTRIAAPPIADAFIDGRAASDVTHLLTELVANATAFSPPTTTVQVQGQLVGRGFVLEVEDRGLGLPEAAREEINTRLADPPEFDLADSERLGLLVVALLARRHGIRVTLGKSPYGGITAIVLLPQTLIVPGLTRRSHSGKNRETVGWQSRRG